MIVLKLAQELASLGVVRIDAPVAKIADEERTAKPAEIFGCQNERPGLLQRNIATTMTLTTLITVRLLVEN